MTKSSADPGLWEGERDAPLVNKMAGYVNGIWQSVIYQLGGFYGLL